VFSSSFRELVFLLSLVCSDAFVWDWQEIRGRCNDTCEVTVESRSYCKRCRLLKCFAVGMKRELILSKTMHLLLAVQCPITH